MIALVLGTMLCLQANAALTDLSADAAELRDAFGGARGTVRLILLLSPS